MHGGVKKRIDIPRRDVKASRMLRLKTKEKESRALEANRPGEEELTHSKFLKRNQVVVSSGKQEILIKTWGKDGEGKRGHGSHGSGPKIFTLWKKSFQCYQKGGTG